MTDEGTNLITGKHYNS